jgi:FKBP-type peptidyl-prolyl cis-trans isomerase FkpA
MKQTTFTLLLLCVIVGLVSCRKKNTELNIRQYDDQQIQNYIASHGLTGVMVKDTSGGDTTGMYYEILTPGNPSQPLADTDKISAVFTLSSFDGLYTSTDTIQNHYCNYVGHITNQGLPPGLRIALLNDMKYNGGSMRVLIPSRMAYGLTGTGSGSKENANSHIAGNQCLDYYIHLINNEPVYDDLVIQNYMKSQSLTGYTKVNSPQPNSQPFYYKVLKPGNGNMDISDNSIIETTYTGTLMDNVVFDGANNGADSVSLQVPNLIRGVQYGLTYASGGSGLISLLIPSGLAYGQNATTGVPVNSCLRFEFEIYSITN